MDPNSIKKYEKQSPNKTILGLKFHLFLYNLAKPEKNKFPATWFRKIGEEPVIWDPLLTERSVDEFKNYTITKGYYDAIVSDSIRLKKKKVIINYEIDLNEPYRINSISYVFEDRGLMDIILPDSSNRLIEKGAPFDKEVLQQERQRLEELMKNNGYFKFSKEFIFFKAKEIEGKKLVDLTILLKEDVEGIPDPITKVRKHYPYKIRNALIYPNYNLYSKRLDVENQIGDTIFLNGNKVIYAGKQKIKPMTVILPNRCSPGSLYQLGNIKRTYSNYSSLELFRIVNINFREIGQTMIDTGKYRYIDCQVELSPRKKQAYQFEIVGTNSDLDLGVRGNLLYNNYNLFRGAENFQVKLTTAAEWGKRANVEPNRRSMVEVGVEGSLTIPKFLVPFKAKEFSRKYNARTIINASYNYQDRREYLRTIANTSYSYRIKGNIYNAHTFTPVDFNLVQVGDIDSAFYSTIENTRLENSFSDHTVLAVRYAFEYSNQVVKKLRDFTYFKTSFESAGNLISAFSDSTFLGVPYFRYLKLDFDFRFNNQITPGNRLVYRIFTGVGYPLGNSQTLPFERMYFSGGPYGIRAWRSEELGPGSFNYRESRYYYNRAEMKLEANVEYRFELFWKLEGALFIDAGNIWSLYQDPEREGGEFSWDRFYKEIAVGTGLGTRLNLSFLLFRVDFGLKMRDPIITEGSRWIDFNPNIDMKFNERVRIQFGIGYPF
jgi:outer membrane protein assembly factor BamA